MSKRDDAKKLFESITDGHANPLIRPADEHTDRVLRELVNDANKSGDCIINVGNGYYRPVPGDPIDEAECRHYLAAELKRAREILLKRMKMTIAYREKGVMT